MINFNKSLHPKHMYRNLRMSITPRVRHEDMPKVDDFTWTNSSISTSIYCEDNLTGQTLFIVPEPKSIREAMLSAYIAGKAAGWKERDAYGNLLLKELFEEEVAHYQLYGYYPDETVKTSDNHVLGKRGHLNLVSG